MYAICVPVCGWVGGGGGGGGVGRGKCVPYDMLE